MKRYRLKLSLPGKAGLIQKIMPNALTFVAYLTPEQAEYQLAAMWFLQAYKIGLDLEEC